MPFPRCCCRAAWKMACSVWRASPSCPCEWSFPLLRSGPDMWSFPLLHVCPAFRNRNSPRRDRECTLLLPGGICQHFILILFCAGISMMLHGRPFRGRKEAFFAHEGRKMLRCFFVPEGGGGEPLQRVCKERAACPGRRAEKSCGRGPPFSSY